MACPEHHLTRAQILAGATLRPALVWAGTGQQDMLSSNGVPIWYDTHGEVHAAAAYTWRHTATGRCGTDGEPEGAARFWPLYPHDRCYPLITLLRTGARRGGYWLAVDTDPAGAGSRDRFQVLDHRDEIAPAGVVWVPARVTAPAVAHVDYPALVADGYTVHGHDGDMLARFDRATVERMITDLGRVHADTNPRTDPMPGEFAVLHLDADVVVVSFEHDNGAQTRLVAIDRVHPDTTGHYAVGAYLWPWSLVD